MESFINILNQIRSTYSEWVWFFLNSNKTWTLIFSIAILIWLVSFIIFLPLHRYSLRKVVDAKKQLTDSVDEIIYLLSKDQYSLSEKETLQYDPCFALMKTMFWSGHFEYIDNLDTIKENVWKVEMLLHQKVISNEQWNKVNRQKNNLRTHTFWSKFLWYELNSVSFGIYNLFW